MSENRLNIGPLGGAVSLRERAYDAMKAAIVQMDIYAPDAELKFDERDLSARFGVSRTPLRQALALLDNERLVKIVARRGIFIVRKTKAEILDMIAVWAALESTAARLVTEVASDADIEALHALVDPRALTGMPEDLGAYSHAHIRFHQAIIEASRSSYISDITNGLFFHMRAIRHRIIGDRDLACRCVEDRSQIVAVLERRDGDRAERLVREHTLMLRDHVARYVDLN
ncbi:MULTISPECIES: GntR family transcriptional regulator [Rhodomicrobium]|uniref:GntR family transcriptional regulator n=1 Tax=Rhodomicrobium TaxID=1068 RepID=UPI000B4AF3A2|nr:MULTISPECIES: GntR family transcriptional regulator [Rhodomicrobium]